MLIKEATYARQGPNMSLALSTGGLIIYYTHTPRVRRAVMGFGGKPRQMRYDVGGFLQSEHTSLSFDQSFTAYAAVVNDSFSAMDELG